MKTNKKPMLFIMCLLILTLLTASLAACTKEDTTPLEIKLKESIDMPDLYVNTEYDAMDLVDKEDGVTYSIKDLYYLDSNFTKQLITFAGTKFTQDKAFDVTLVIAAKKGSKESLEVIELKINYLTDSIIDSYMGSWVDDGVVRKLVANSDYLFGEAKTSINIRYVGSYNPLNDGVSVGKYASALGSCSVKDWSNAVVSMDIYNPNKYELVFGISLKNNGEWGKAEMTHSLPSEKWSKVNWSLRSMGVSAEDFVEAGGEFSFKVRVPDGSAPFDYSYYICNMDVFDYSATQFPGLETRTDEEIRKEKFDSLAGDAIDKTAVCYAKYDSKYDATTDTTEFKSSLSPVSTSSIKYTYSKESTNGLRANMLTDTGEMKDFYTVTDWANAYVGFWIKTVNYDISIALRFQNTQDGTTYKGSKETVFDGYNYNNNRSISKGADWQFVQISLNDLGTKDGTSPEPIFEENVTGYKLFINTEIDLANGAKATFYIDGLSIYTEKIDAIDDTLANISGDNEYKIAINSSDKTNIMTGSNSSVKYTFTRGTDGASRKRFLDDTTGKLFKHSEVTDWSKAYVEFYIKNTTGVPTGADSMAITFKFQTKAKDATDYVGSANLDFDNNNNKKVDNNSEWQKFEFKLSDLGIGTTNVETFRLVVSSYLSDAFVTTQPVSFYLDGLRIYSK